MSKTKTNGSGVYTSLYLRPGQYEVPVSATGMKEAGGGRGDQGNISRVDVALQVGSVSDVVQATDVPPLLEQETTTFNTSVDRQSGTGNAYASFLVGAVDNASMTYADEPDYHTQAFNVYAG